MNPLTPPPSLLKPRRLRHLAAAFLAYVTAVCASMAAAAAVVAATLTLMPGG